MHLKRYLFIIFIGMFFSIPLNILTATPVSADAYGLYSETYSGMKHDVSNPPDPDGGYIGTWVYDYSIQLSSATATGEFTDGEQSLKAVVTGAGDGGAGWYIQFGYPAGPTSQVATDMSDYSNGYLKFDVKTNGEILVKIEWYISPTQKGSQQSYLNGNLGVPLDNDWHSVSVPLSYIDVNDLKNIMVPAGFHAVDMGSVTYYIDNVRWTKTSGPEFSITPGEITWSSVDLATADWLAADQPLEVKVESNDMAWGIQIYTDNTETDANPKWAGGSGTNPCGLLEVISGQSTSTVRLPICWRIMDNTTDYTHLEIYETVASDTGGANHLRCPAYGAPATTNYNCWFWMMDELTSGFGNGDDYVTIWNQYGVHHAEGDNWGVSRSPNYIYIGAKFSSAVAQKTYKTNKLIVEFFYQ